VSNETSHQTLENLGHEDRSFPPEAEFSAQANGTEDLTVIQPMRLFHASNLYLSLLFVAVALDPLLTR